MKFAGFEEIYRKFFPESENLFWGYSHWCRDRLRKLRLNGLVKTFQFPGSPRKYLIATEKGRRALLREWPLCGAPWALKKPQYVHFEHDLMVLRVRQTLEEAGLIRKWISERFLKIEFGDLREVSIEKFNIPDGIFEEISGQRVALEVEMSHKARAKYREKTKYQAGLMRSPIAKDFEFQRVLYLCLSKAVAKTLKEETCIYGDLFEVETIEEFFLKNLKMMKVN